MLDLSSRRRAERPWHPGYADDFRLAYSRNLTERLTLDANVRDSGREDLLSDLCSYEYRYGAALLAFSWKLDESWTAGLVGTYTRQEYQISHSDADGRRVGLSLAWRPLQ